MTLARRGPEHRAEPDRFERSDPEEIRVQPAWHKGHHRDEGVDHKDVLREERQREQHEGEAERGFRLCVDHTLNREQRRREGNVRATHSDASDH